MTTPESVIKRALKLGRRESYLTLLHAIETRPLSASERQRFRGVIMAKTLSGAITPRDARKLTKALDGESDLKKKG